MLSLYMPKGALLRPEYNTNNIKLFPINYIADILSVSDNNL